jgi:type VI secretion system protein ImpE
MNAEEYLRQGDLSSALEALQKQVRANPSDVKCRIFLFQLLCVMGDWDRALIQLNVAGDMDAGTLAMVHTYRGLVQCEALRRSVFAGRRHPLVFGEPEQWIALVLEALRLEGSGSPSKAQGLRSEAFDSAPAPSGVVNGQKFEWIADADVRIGPFVEAIVNGNYYWIPFHRISEINCDGPEDLRDLVWNPTRFRWANGGEAVGFIPTRYTGTEEEADDQLRLARRTDWLEAGDGVFAGRGQRMLATDESDYSLLEVRSITLNSSDATD